MGLAEKINCWSFANVLDLYVDKRLTPFMMANVGRHLETCAGCKQLAAELAPIKAPSTAVAPPPGLADSILKAFEEGAAPAQSAFSFRLAPAQIAAMLYLMILAGAHTAPGAPHQGPPQVFGERQ